MKTQDLITVITTAAVGTMLAYFLMNSLIGDPRNKSVSFEYVDSASSALVSPNPDVFNIAAINPTVEVYIGTCTDLNHDGIISSDELVACGEATESTGDTETVTQQEESDENTELNVSNGLAPGTSSADREAVLNNIEAYRNSQNTNNASSADSGECTDADCTVTVSGE